MRPMYDAMRDFNAMMRNFAEVVPDPTPPWWVVPWVTLWYTTTFRLGQFVWRTSAVLAGLALAVLFVAAAWKWVPNG